MNSKPCARIVRKCVLRLCVCVFVLVFMHQFISRVARSSFRAHQVSQSCASMRNAPDTEFTVHFLLLLFSRAFYVYPLLFRSLQYIYESLYHSYPSICLCYLQRQPESYSLSCFDHANNLRLLIRFQHDIYSFSSVCYGL